MPSITVPQKVLVKPKGRPPYYSTRQKKIFITPDKARSLLEIVPTRYYTGDLEAIYRSWVSYASDFSSEEEKFLLFPILALQEILYKNYLGFVAIMQNRIVGVASFEPQGQNAFQLSILSASPYDVQQGKAEQIQELMEIQIGEYAEKHSIRFQKSLEIEKAPHYDDISDESTKILVKDGSGKILIIKDAYSDWWDLPGGQRREDERTEKSASREMHEEIGLRCSPGHLTLLGQKRLKLNVTKDVTFFTIHLSGRPKIKLSEEHEDSAWIGPEEIEKYNLGVFAPIIRDAFSGFFEDSAGVEDVAKQATLAPPRPGLVPKEVPVHLRGRVTRGIRWVRPEEGQKVTGSGIRVPPAWSEVWINSDGKAPLQVVGIDAKGRTQYLYSREHSEKAAAEKFSRFKDFSKEIPKMRKQIQKDALKNDEASILYLIDKAGIRIGSDRDTLAKKKAYGAATLEGRHVKVDGDEVIFDFDAKKGTHVSKVIEDPFLARIFASRKTDGNERIFDTTGGKVRQYMAGLSKKKFSPKDFRTYYGTQIALQTVGEMPIPVNKKELAKAKKLVGQKAADFLGNTATVALSAYIQPEVFAAWEAKVAQELNKTFSNNDDLADSVHYDAYGDWEKEQQTEYDPDDAEPIKDEPVDFDNIYDWIDKQLNKAGLSLKTPSQFPRGAKTVGNSIERLLYNTLAEQITDVIQDTDGNESETQIFDAIEFAVNYWYDQNQEGRYRIGDRVKIFADDTIKDFAEIIRESYTPEGVFSLDHLRGEMSKVVSAKRYELERIARTETGQVSNLGRIFGWAEDPDKLYYEYLWSSTPDNRRREMKKLRSNGNPYTWSEIVFLFTHNEQLLPNGKWQNGNINCRCTVTRSPVDDEFRGFRFRGQEPMFRKTVAFDMSLIDEGMEL